MGKCSWKWSSGVHSCSLGEENRAIRFGICMFFEDLLVMFGFAADFNKNISATRQCLSTRENPQCA